MPGSSGEPSKPRSSAHTTAWHSLRRPPSASIQLDDRRRTGEAHAAFVGQHHRPKTKLGRTSSTTGSASQHMWWAATGEVNFPPHRRDGVVDREDRGMGKPRLTSQEKATKLAAVVYLSSAGGPVAARDCAAAGRKQTRMKSSYGVRPRDGCCSSRTVVNCPPRSPPLRWTSEWSC
jgi:hypothetical protein